jgi:predicted ribosome-associated RNA-binding protein Tma20
LGREDVVTDRAAVTTTVSGAVALAPELSATCAVKFDVPAADGVPLITPAELSDSPVGSVPALTVHEYPPVPPLAARVCEYAVPTTPFGNDDVVTDSGALTTIVKGALAFPPELSAT